jgi:ABC-type Na+ efflux pump permease subunit
MSNAQPSDSPIATSLLAMTAAALEQCSLSDREIMVARIAALAAMGATPFSYALNAGLAADSGLDLEDAQGILVAVAPVIGTALTTAATFSIAEGLGLAALALSAEDD